MGMKLLSRLAGIFTLIALVGSPVGMTPALAQTPPYLPSVEVVEGQVVAPDTAWTSYFDPLNPSSQVDPIARHEEIKSLARGLRYDIDLIYEHIRNTVELTPIFGLQKGALGAHLDSYGTPFDQAHLMVELLREADAVENKSYNAKYVLGKIRLSASQFEDWFGITNASAAVDVLADGGFPADVTDNGAGNVQSVEIMHVWVEATIGGQTYAFDPSFKLHDFLQPIDLSGAMQYSQSALLSAAGGTTGTQNGVDYVQNINVAGLESKLEEFAENLTIELSTNHDDKAPPEVLGGKIIKPYFLTDDGPIRDAQPGPYTWLADYDTWINHIPDEFRTKIRIRYEAVDEIHFAEHFFIKLIGFYNGTVGSSALRIDSNALMMFPVHGSSSGPVAITVNIDHPYAAKEIGNSNYGTYMDREIKKSAASSRASYLSIDLGHTSQGSVAYKEGISALKDPKRGGHSAATPLQLMSQYARLAQLCESIADITHQHHHSVGLYRMEEEDTSAVELGLTIQATLLVSDVESAFSVTANDGVSSREQPAAEVIVAGFSAFEASLSEQVLNSRHTYASTSLFNWHAINGNKKFYIADDSADLNQITLTGYSTTERDWIEAYLDSNDNFDVLLPDSGNLGDTFISNQQTSAFVAYTSGANKIAHVTVNSNTGDLVKGAGGGAFSHSDFTANRSEGLLAGVNASQGQLSYSAPADITVGTGSFPASLSFRRTYDPKKHVPDWGSIPYWNHNWEQNLTLRSDGLVALGSLDAQDAAATIATFIVASDILGASSSPKNRLITILSNHWMTRQIVDNTTVITHGLAGPMTFVRQIDGAYRQPAGTIVDLQVSGTTTVHPWGRTDYSDLSFTYTNEKKSVKEYKFFGDGEVTSPTDQRRIIPAFVLDQWTFPTGTSIDFTYEWTEVFAGFPGPWGGDRIFLSKVKNSLGRELNFTWNDDNVPSYPLGEHPFPISVSDGLNRTVTFDVDLDDTWPLRAWPKGYGCRRKCYDL